MKGGKHPHIPTNISLPKFGDAVEAFKGYPCFADIPEPLFARIVKIADAQEVDVNHARDRIAQVIWQDQVVNSMRDLTPEDKKELSTAIRKEVAEKLVSHAMTKDREERSDRLRLVR